MMIMLVLLLMLVMMIKLEIYNFARPQRYDKCMKINYEIYGDIGVVYLSLTHTHPRPYTDLEKTNIQQNNIDKNNSNNRGFLD